LATYACRREVSDALSLKFPPARGDRKGRHRQRCLTPRRATRSPVSGEFNARASFAAVERP